MTVSLLLLCSSPVETGRTIVEDLASMVRFLDGETLQARWSSVEGREPSISLGRALKIGRITDLDQFEIFRGWLDQDIDHVLRHNRMLARSVVRVSARICTIYRTNI